MAALAIWLYAELFAEDASERTELPTAVSNHDRNLANLLAKDATDGLILFLERHDFGATWRKEWVDPVYRLTYLFENPTTEFDDEHLQKALQRAEAATLQLVQKLSHWGGPIDAVDLFSMIPTREKDLDDWSELTQERVRETNKSADNLALAFRDMLRTFRKKGIDIIDPLQAAKDIELPAV